MGYQLRQFVIKAWHGLHAFWLIIGISLAILLLMETCVRVKNAAGSTPPVSRSPQASAPWFSEFTREYDATRPQRWKSYLYFGRLPSFKGRYVNIDSAGHRVTPQPATPATPVAKVFFFGGSTMWGTEQRDDHTIAAEAARRLQVLAGPGNRIQVTNFGESGYVTTQELLALMLELRARNIPDVVVFYDGINDVGTTVQYGGAGIPQNESKRVAEFALGRAIDRAGFERGLRKDMKAWRALGGESLKQFALFEWVQSLKPKPKLQYIAADSAARSTTRVYTENMRMAESLARTYGFEVIYVWQPNVHSTEKILTPAEDRIVKGINSDDFQRRIRETQIAISPILDSAMATVAPARFVNAALLFKGDTLSVFVDRIGHNTEISVPRIVDAFWPTLEAAIVRRHTNTPANSAKIVRRRTP